MVGQQRLALLDILRGLAILGILLVNVEFFQSPIYSQFVDTGPPDGALDRWADRAVRLLAQGKFYTMFALLFGAGMAIQLQRARARRREQEFGQFFATRMAWLLAIGVVHATLIWYGDILVSYALMGLFLLLFRDVSNRALSLWAVALWFLPTAAYTLIVAGIELALAFPESATLVQQALERTAADHRDALERATRIHRDGTPARILVERLRQLQVMVGVTAMALPGILAMFLVGFQLARRDLFRRAPDLGPWIAGKLLWLWPVGLLGNLVFTLAAERANPVIPSWTLLLSLLGQTVGAPALCLAYVGSTALALQRAAGRRLLQPLAAVGRTALSNYLLQSLVMTALCDGWGLGLYRSIGPAAGVGLALAVFAVQIVLSNAWLRHFRFGPAEWLWRSLAYRRLQPFRARRADDQNSV